MPEPDDQLERGRWQETPLWLFWKPRWRRPVYAFFGPRVRWEYATQISGHEV